MHNHPENDRERFHLVPTTHQHLAINLDEERRAFAAWARQNCKDNTPLESLWYAWLASAERRWAKAEAAPSDERNGIVKVATMTVLDLGAGQRSARLQHLDGWKQLAPGVHPLTPALLGG